MQTEELTPSKTSPQDRQPIKDEDFARSLREIIEHFDTADQPVRDRQVRKWRKQMCYWDHIQYVYWSEIAHDWRTPDQAASEFPEDSNVSIDPTLYAKVINIYRAHGEVIIAAMSAQTPRVIFPPYDADNPNDVLSSKSRSKLAELINKHNYAELLLVKALYILYNQGVVFGYNENFDSPEFGEVEVPITEEVPVTVTETVCPNCLEMLGSERSDSAEMDDPAAGGPAVNDALGMEGGMPAEDSNVLAANIPPSPAPVICPSCQQEVIPESQSYEESEEQQTGVDYQNKCRELISVWGPLNVKVPAWIRRLKDSPYLMLETEEHYAMLQSIYPEISAHINEGDSGDTYDRSMRTPTQYEGDTPRDLQTVKRCWLRPWAYNVLGVKDTTNLERVEELREMFPDGCYVVIIGDDLVAEAVPDKLDEHWTATCHPLSETIHAESLGAPEMPVQEMLNETANLTLESIEHQIPEVYADSDAIDFEKYGESEARPGMTYPANKRPGESLSNSFYEVKGGSLSKEVAEFTGWLERQGQFVIGALPSIFGGALEGGSNTAREYEISRSQALQRLTLTWRFVTIWWTELTDKAVKSFVKNMVGDERYVQDKGGGNFVNVWIRQIQLTGETGDAYPENSETLPFNWNQKRDVLLQMFQMKNPMVDAVISHPENSGLVARLIGLSELYIPGDDDRTKQLREISELLQGQPQETIDEMGQPQGVDEMGGLIPPVKEVSSVPIEPDIDNHAVEAETCRAWMKTEVGQETKRTNPAGYYNVLLHCKEHDAVLAERQAQQQQAELEQKMTEKALLGEPQDDGPPSKKKESDVASIGA